MTAVVPALVLAGAAAVLVRGPAPPSVSWPVDRVRKLTRRPRVGRRRAATADRARTLALLEAFAAELRAGRPATVALARAAQPCPDLVPATLGALQLGGDVPTALIADAIRSPVLRRLAACWRAGERSGAGLAAAVTRLAAGTRDSERLRLELAARTAEPRASARVLALLPAFGLVLGAGLGADTLGWLLGTPPGRLVLVAGLALDLAGVLWSRQPVGAVVATL